MRKINYAIIILLLVGLNSCDEDNKTVKYKSNDFVGEWNVVSVLTEYDISKNQIESKILNDTLTLNSDGTASVSSTVYKDDGTFDFYIRTKSGTWIYTVDSKYINIDILFDRLDINGKVFNDSHYLVVGNVESFTPKLVVQKYIINGFGNYTEIKELVKIK